MEGVNVPIYEYDCSLCSERFEVRMGFDADSVKCCPSCGGRAERVISAVPFMWKDGHKPSGERISKVNPSARQVGR